MARQRDLYQILNDHETDLHGLKATLARVAAAAITSHGGLTDLLVDDHTQYHNDARAVTWLATQTEHVLRDGTRAMTGSLAWPAGFGVNVAMTAGDGGDLRIDSQVADIFDVGWVNGPDDGSYATLRFYGNSNDHLDLELLDGSLSLKGGSVAVWANGDLNLYNDAASGIASAGIQGEDAGGSLRWMLRGEMQASPPFTAVSNRAIDGEVRMYANTSTAGGAGEVLAATFRDTEVEIADGVPLIWSNASLPHIALDSDGGGADTWTDQGAYIKLGESASTESGSTAVSISYVGNGYGYFGNGGMTSGIPAYGFAIRHNVGQMLALNSGTSGNPFYGFLGDVNLGMYRIGADELGFSANGLRLLIGTYGIKIDTSDDILPRTDNSSGLGASGARFIDVWAVDGSINTSDEEGKKFILPMHRVLDASQFVMDLEPVKFVRKGRTRMHMGWTAQGVKAAMDNQGVDWGAYIDPAVGGVPEGKREEDGFGVGPKGLRTGELIPVLWQSQRESQIEIAALKGRISVLESNAEAKKPAGR